MEMGDSVSKIYPKPLSMKKMEEKTKTGLLERE
jgi:hypothetical protein